MLSNDANKRSKKGKKLSKDLQMILDQQGGFKAPSEISTDR